MSGAVPITLDVLHIMVVLLSLLEMAQLPLLLMAFEGWVFPV
jgi:hypothetical protein